MAERQKVSKEAAQYEHPARGPNHCGLCKYFEAIEPKHCSRVEGLIRPEDWCRLFRPKSRFAEAAKS